MMPWRERRRCVEASRERFIRITSTFGVQWRASRRAFRVTVLFAVTRVRVGASGHGETAYGEAASSKSEEVTYACTMLCRWYLEVLPTHHLPWAGFGSVWP